MKNKFNKDDIFRKLLIQDGRVYLKEDDKLEFIEEYDKLFPEGKHAKQELSPELQYKIAEHGKLCDCLKNLYATKNADYGDSMHPLFEEYGLTAFLVLFGIKIQRIKNLKDKDSRNYESLEDSLLDLANYALIAVTEIRAKNKDSEKDLSEAIKNTEGR